MRIVVAVFSVLFFVGHINASIKLKDAQVIQKEFLSLSDFFAGLDPTLDQEILEAPSVGQKKHYPHSWVVQLAKNFNINWVPEHNMGIEFSRTSQETKTVNIQNEIQDYIVSNYPNRCVDPFEIKFDNALTQNVLTSNNGENLVKNFQWVGRNNFVVTINSSARTQKIRGTFFSVAYVPTLNKTKYPGQVIEKEDISFTAVKEREITSKTLMVESDIIGKTLGRRMIKANTPIKEVDVVNPKVIKKGDLITIKVETKNIVITARGKAEKAAAVGDTVQVLNLQSKKTIEGIVKNSHTVVIPILR